MLIIVWYLLPVSGNGIMWWLKHATRRSCEDRTSKRLKPSTLTTNKAFNIHFLLSFWNHSKISVLIPVYSNLVTVHTEIKRGLKMFFPYYSGLRWLVICGGMIAGLGGSSLLCFCVSFFSFGLINPVTRSSTRQLWRLKSRTSWRAFSSLKKQIFPFKSVCGDS